MSNDSTESAADRLRRVNVPTAHVHTPEECALELDNLVHNHNAAGLPSMGAGLQAAARMIRSAYKVKEDTWTPTK